MIDIFAIPIFTDNYIWIIRSKQKKKIWAVDPGLAQPLIDYCNKNDFTLEGIFITHHHADHTGGLVDLLSYNCHLTVYGPEGIRGVSYPVNEKTVVLCEKHQWSVYETPGHTLDHVAYFSDTMIDKPVLFIGDTLFSLGCGKLFEGTAEMFVHSLNKIKKLPDSTLIYCTHEYTLANISFALALEPANENLLAYKKEVEKKIKNNQPSLPTNLALEKKLNPFLRVSNPIIIEKTSQWAKKDLIGEEMVFSVLRQWKDRFSG